MIKRYYSKKYDELYYIFDSKVLSEKEFDEKEDYEGYSAFADSLSCNEIVDLLNENEELKQQVKYERQANKDILEDYTKINKENEQLKQRINSRLHFYRGLYEETNNNIVKRVIEDLEDILR